MLINTPRQQRPTNRKYFIGSHGNSDWGKGGGLLNELHCFKAWLRPNICKQNASLFTVGSNRCCRHRHHATSTSNGATTRVAVSNSLQKHACSDSFSVLSLSLRTRGIFNQSQPFSRVHYKKWNRCHSTRSRATRTWRNGISRVVLTISDSIVWTTTP